jgi:fructose-1,6-bisphosphatase/inositol monophosphatase family enzyme
MATLAQPLAGVVYAAAFDRMYAAASKDGATCNGLRLVTPSVSQLRNAIVGVSYGSLESSMEVMGILFSQLAKQVRKIRILGATGLDLSLLAAGSIHGLIQPRTRIWDFAAARIILEESGGYFKAWPHPRGGWRLLAAARPLETALGVLLATVLPAQYLHSR